jgi:hypothetical protein
MAYALLNYTGDGSTTTFAISFPYIVESHVKVYVSGSLKIQGVDYNIVSSNVVFVTAPAAAAAISLRRNTSQDSRIAAFQDGVTLTQSALDTNSKQSFYMSQEAIDSADTAMGIEVAGFDWDAEGKQIHNLASPTNATDATNKTYVDTTITNNITAAAGALFVPTAGGTMTGALTLSGAPTAGLHAATKTYADSTGPNTFLAPYGFAQGATTAYGTDFTVDSAVSRVYRVLSTAVGGPGINGAVQQIPYDGTHWWLAERAAADDRVEARERLYACVA